MASQPLVSVIVVCYNAASYIVETLESVKAQTYKNIELIVSDDNSNDDTLSLAKNWLEGNKDSFVRTELITVAHNTGVSANYNRAVKACRGSWIKNIDGDDLITANCIEENIKYITEHPDCRWVFSQVQCFIVEGVHKRELGFVFDGNKELFFHLDTFEQFKQLLHDNLLPSQSSFIETEVLKQHPYNETYKGLEDWPMWLTLTRNGIQAHYFDICTSLYRLSDSITSSQERFFSPLYFESRQKFFWLEVVNYIKQYGLTEAYNQNRRFLLTMEFADIILKNKRSRFRDLIFRIGRRLIYKRVIFRL